MRSTIVTEEDARPRARSPWGFVVTASVFTLGTVALIWVVGVLVGAGVCPAIDPPPTSCSASYRAGSGLVATVVVLILSVVTIVAVVFSRPVARRFAVAGVLALAVSPFVSYAAVAWSPGFPLAGANEETVSTALTVDPVGQWGEIGERSASLTISDDGTVTGSGGCNGVSGTWTVSDGRVVFSDMVTSLMMCPHFESALQGPVVTAVVTGDTITVLDERGDVTGVLPRLVSP